MGRNCAIIVAAGRGSRMNASINKQFLLLKGKPILWHTIRCFEENSDIDDIVLVLAKEDFEYFKSNVDFNIFKKISNIIFGGDTRQSSVVNGLNAAQVEEKDVVLIHDGARPFVSKDIISNGIEYAKKYKAAACGVRPKDTIKVVNTDGFGSKTLVRDELVCIQTPQCFQYKTILESHRKINKSKIIVTDDTAVVEACGHKVYVYPGSYNNIKITTPEDLQLGEIILNSKNILT
ncbi:2-C-methyl-D-erythritol 4-phosphate cytidylyltransferase [Clostridium sp. DL1XJH146]